MFGVFAPGEDVAKLTYYGLYALQHRGQEAAGHRGLGRRADRRVQGPRPGLAGVRRAEPVQPARAHRRRAHPVLHHRVHAPGRTPSRRSASTVGRHRDRVGAQRESGEHRRAGRPDRHRSGVRPDGRHLGFGHHHPVDRGHRRPTPGSPRRRWRSCRRCRARSAWCSATRTRCTRRGIRNGVRPAGARPAGARLGDRVGDRGAGHRRCLVRPRGRARRTPDDRRGRAVQSSTSRRPTPRAACSSTSTWPVRTPPSPVAASTPPGSRSADGWPARPRSRPTW